MPTRSPSDQRAAARDFAARQMTLHVLSRMDPDASRRVSEALSQPVQGYWQGEVARNEEAAIMSADVHAFKTQIPADNHPSKAREECERRAVDRPVSHDASNIVRGQPGWCSAHSRTVARPARGMFASGLQPRCAKLSNRRLASRVASAIWRACP